MLKVLAHYDALHAHRTAAQSSAVSEESAGAVSAVKFDATGVVARTYATSKHNAKMMLASHPILLPGPP